MALANLCLMCPEEMNINTLKFVICIFDYLSNQTLFLRSTYLTLNDQSTFQNVQFICVHHIDTLGE